MRFRLVLFALAALAMPVPAGQAAERHAYDVATFESALDSGRSILVHVTAVWCGECRRQKPIVAALADRPEFADLIIVDVDFDTQKDALRRFHVQKQSTLVVIKAKIEVARAVGITQPGAI